MSLRALLMLTAAACVGLCAAQTGENNPVLKASTYLAFRGAPSAKAPATSPGQFKPSGKTLAVAGYVKAITEEKSEVEALTEYFETALGVQADWGKSNKAENDFIAAYANAIAVAAMICTGEEVTDAATLDLLKNLRASLDVPAIRNAKDAEKQEVYEIAVCHSALVLLTASAAKEEAGLKSARELATGVLGGLIGVRPSELVIGKDTFTIKPNGKEPPKESGATNPPAVGGLAPGFSYKTPAGWQQNGAWLVKEGQYTANSPENVCIANVRFPAPIPASGNMGDALWKLWDKEVPAELKGKAGGMVYRRYTGDGLLTQFIFGKGLEKDRRSDSVFTVYLVDCKTYWQPVVVALTYEDRGQFRAGESFMAGSSYGVSATLAEEVLATLTCPSAKGQPLVTMESLAGDYGYGSGANMQYMNVYTGATSMSYVSYGGTLHLKPNGTFTYTFSSASSNGGLANFAGAKGEGTWKIEGDIVTCSFKKYDQGQGNQTGKVYTYRVAGLTQFQDGTKVAVLLDDLKSVPNSCTVGDSSDWFTTGKK